MPACSSPSRITYPEDVRYPLVSDLPGIFTLVNAMSAAPVVIPVVNRNIEYKVCMYKPRHFGTADQLQVYGMAS